MAVTCRTSAALSAHCRPFSGFLPAKSSSWRRMVALRSSTLVLERDRPSSTCVKPSRTSLDTFSASMAVRTIYMRFIIF